MFHRTARGVALLDCSIVIVAYRSGPDLAEFLPTVAAALRPCTWHVTIVNNAALDDLNGWVQESDHVTVIEAHDNLGYSGGLNLGVDNAPPARHVIFLNPDLTLRPESVSKLIGELNAGAAAAVPLILDSDGRMQLSLRREPTLLSALGDALFGDAWASRPGWLSETVRETSAYASPHLVDWATGAVLAVRAEVVEQVGRWDSERFFLYSEETDYFRRIRAEGGQIHFVPSAVVQHRGAGSGASAQLDALLEVNKLRYFEKWHHPFAAGVFGLLRLFHNVIRQHRPGARAAVRALLSSAERAKLPGRHRVRSAA